MLKSMWTFSKIMFIAEWLLAFINGILAPINAYLLKLLIENITEEEFQTSLWIIATIALVNLVCGFIRALLNRKLNIEEDIYRSKLLFEFFSKVADMDYEILYTTDMIRNKEMALNAIQKGMAFNYLNIMFSCFSGIVTFISVLYLLSSISVWIYILVLVLTLFRVLSVITDKKRKFKATLELAGINAENSYYFSILTDETYANDIKMYSTSEWIMNKSIKCLNESMTLFKKLSVSLYKGQLIRNAISCIELIFPYVYATFQMFYNNMSFANFTLITTTLKNFNDSITKITTGLIDLGENSAYVKIYIDFMKVKNVVAIPDKGIPIEEVNNSDIIFEFKDVCFKYPSSENLVLENINLKIECGKFYVLVGENGAGKTTLVRLLCRLYDVGEGTLSYMNTNIKDIEYKSYRNNVGVVFQDYKYYCLSLAENVAMNDYRDCEEVNNRVINALVNAGLGEKLRSLPKGIHTKLGKTLDNDGILLSGGEQQKLALARALFKDTPVVILDEPSSALDAFAENELITTFNSVLKDKTVIYISHRLSVANYADKVIYINDGRIKGFDTHENLLNKVPSYREMYEAQANHYK